MSAPTWAMIRNVFDEAILLAEGERETFVRSACGDDAEHRRAVMELLRASKRADEANLLEHPLPIAGQVRAASMPERLGRYVVIAELGSGGMGIVFLARDPELKRHVAIKLINDERRSDPRFRKQLRREARRLAALQHPGVAMIHEIGEWDDVPFLVLEYVSGVTLAEALQRGRMELERVVEIATQLAAAIHAAHDRGILHRDLKPANIKLTPEGSVKVLDFGIARDAAASGTAHEESIALSSRYLPAGTAGYASPEILRQEPPVFGSDIFAFGCVLYECVTGRFAFPGRTPIDRITETIAGHVDLEALEGAAPGPLARIIRSCLAQKAAKRPRSMEEVLRALEAIDRSSLADHRTSPIHRVMRRARPALARLSPAAAAGLLGLVAITWWLSERRVPPPALDLTDPRISASAIAPWSGRPVAITGYEGSGPNGGEIRARDLNTGDVLWTAAPRVDELLDVFGSEFMLEGAFAVSRLAFVDLTGDGEQELVAIHAHHLWYPSMISAYHRDGTRLGTYYNPGRLQEVVSADLDRDGKRELIVVGTSNAPVYQGATLFVLDATHMQGAAFDSAWQPANRACTLGDTSLIRIVAPAFAPDFMDAATNARRLDGTFVRVGSRAGATVISFDVSFGDGAIVVDCDADLRPIRASPSDALISAVRGWPGGLGERFLDPAHLDGWLAAWLRFGVSDVARSAAGER